MTDTPDPRTYPRKSACSFSARIYPPPKGKQMIRAPHCPPPIRADIRASPRKTPLPRAACQHRQGAGVPP